MNCCISGCINKSRTPLNKSKGVKFYYFPKNNIYKPWICEKRQQWIKAVKKHTKCPKNWLPTESTRICSEHFIGNKKSDNAKHPSYVPTIFPGAENNRHKKMVQKERTYTREELLEAVRLVEQKKLNSYAAAEQFRIPRLIIADHIYYREKQESLKRKFTSTEREPVQPEFDFDLFESEFEPKSEPDCELQRQCTQCQEVLLGFVFLCVECLARSCSACDARGLHAAHLVLRAPAARPESELELVLNKIRDALCLDVEGTQTNPDQPVEESPQEPEEDYIKMEIETEEEQPIWHESVSGAPANTDEEPDVEHQSMSWAGRDAGGDESDSSCTLTASTPSEDSSSDDDQALLVARPTRPAAPPTRPAAPPTRPAAPPTRPAAPPTRPAAPPTRPAAPHTRPAAPSTRPAAPPTRPATPPHQASLAPRQAALHRRNEPLHRPNVLQAEPNRKGPKENIRPDEASVRCLISTHKSLQIKLAITILNY
ncbi:uncharacterized protein LOC135084075 [Ostrinia nubilalis]|uniref:uncharacterized protein LOC135084075 n=1 Tax=Ostrinia nubilalis TaxID=29057 RepID=UPI0030825850